jgi:hypothetical protein
MNSDESANKGDPPKPAGAGQSEDSQPPVPKKRPQKNDQYLVQKRPPQWRDPWIQRLALKVEQYLFPKASEKTAVKRESGTVKSAAQQSAPPVFKPDPYDGNFAPYFPE